MMKIGCLLVLALSACSGGESDPLPVSNGRGPAPFDPGTPYSPRVTPSELKPQTTNVLFPMPVGARWVLEANTADGLERIEITVIDGAVDAPTPAAARSPAHPAAHEPSKAAPAPADHGHAAHGGAP